MKRVVGHNNGCKRCKDCKCFLSKNKPHLSSADLDINSMNIYKGYRKKSNCVSDNLVTVNGEDFEKLMLQKSLKIRNHSPTGYNWSYGGSGPHQLAIALLFHVTNDVHMTESHVRDFVMEYVSRWGDTWEMTDAEIRNWLQSKHAELN